MNSPTNDTRQDDFEGLSFEGERDAGNQVITCFAILPGREAAAGRAIVEILSGGGEVSLCNAEDEGNEGATTFRCSNARIESMAGGHGWQGEWMVREPTEVLTMIADLAPHNRGGHWGAQGSIRKWKHSGARAGSPTRRSQKARPWRWVLVVAVICGLHFTANVFVSAHLRNGVRDLVENLNVAAPSDSSILAPVGPATRDALNAVTKHDYTVSVQLFDGAGESLTVTHTAIVESSTGRIGLRVRFDPFDFKFHVVGFYTIR